MISRHSWHPPFFAPARHSLLRPLRCGLLGRPYPTIIKAAGPSTTRDSAASIRNKRVYVPARQPDLAAANNIAPLTARFKRWTARTPKKQPAEFTIAEKVPSRKTSSKLQLISPGPTNDPKANKANIKANGKRPSKASDAKNTNKFNPPSRKQPVIVPSSADAQVSQQTAAVASAKQAGDTAIARLWQSVYRPAALVFASAHVMATACAVTDVASSPPWMPPTVGAAVGLLFAALNRYGVVRWWRAPAAPLRVVITGSSKGIGKALARQFLRAGDHVIVTARSGHAVRTTVAELRAEMGPSIRVTGFDVNVSSPASVARLADGASAYFGGVIDVWVNNAGYSGSFQPLVKASAAQVQEVVTTNMLGTLLATRAAIQTMQNQKTAGHIFNVDGAGSDGSPTPNYAAYGATKLGIAHLMGSVSAELEAAGSTTAVHTVSPGMVLTGLLLSGATAANKRAFNILCEQPETIAAYLVPRMRTVVARGGKQHYIRYLTPSRALWFFLMAPLRMRRFFDSEGRQLYEDEWSRLFGPLRKRTERLAAAAAQRTSTLGMVYSLSMTAAFLLIATASAMDASPPMPL